MVCDGNDCTTMEETKRDVAELRENLTYLTHQMYRILLALHVPLCQCAVCAEKHQAQNDLIIQSTNVINGTNGDQSDCSAHSSNGVELPNGVNGSHPITPDVAPPPFAERVSDQSLSNATQPLNNVDCQALLSQLFAPANNGSLMMSTPLSDTSSPLYSGRGRPPLGVTVSPRTQPRTGQPPGRKSKYCTAGEKKAVAIYAAQHGASAAARKFNIPPAVAAYYHRKEYKRGLPKGRRPSCAGDPTSAPIVSFPTMVPPPTEASPGTVSDDHDSFNDDWKQEEMTIDGDPINPDNANKDMTKTSGLSFESMYAGSDGGGSPGFLRGRGRGRPKLIGDELDADLVDFMVRVKQEDPRRHISATRALERARDYIRLKAPGLLEEDGGLIKLRLTWAMKLMARVAERERELYPNLHPASIASMPILPKPDVYNDLSDTLENVVVAASHSPPNGQLMH